MKSQKLAKRYVVNPRGSAETTDEIEEISEKIRRNSGREPKSYG